MPRRTAILALLGLLACEAGPRSAAPTEGSAMPRPAAHTPGQAAILEKLTAVLPEGWIITRSERDVVPDGWISERAAGLLVEGRKGADTFRIWFLPRDWIGIRKPGAVGARANYWEGILAGGDHVTITVSTERTIPERIRKLGMETTSIINSGWRETERVFRGRFAVAETVAEHLIARSCPDRASRDEAARSLVVLGIPAASVFRRTALEGTGDAQQFAVSALSHFPGAESVAAISAVLRDPATSDQARGYAGAVAEDLAAPELGAPLLEALALSRDLDTRSRIIRGIGRLRYTPAASAVLAALEEADSAPYRAGFAGALASLRHRPAIPAIRKLAEGPGSEDVRDRARAALRVLTGDWGAPAEGLRFLLEGPGAAVAGKPIEVVIHVENVGDRREDFFAAVGGQLFIDDAPRERMMRSIDGMSDLHPNVVRASTEDVATWLKKPGTYRVRYAKGAARSNTLTVVVKSGR